MASVQGNVGATKAAGLLKVMMGGFDDEVEVLSQVTNEIGTEHAYEEWTSVTMPGVPEQKTKGATMARKNIHVQTPTRITIKSYAADIAVHFEDLEDDRYSTFANLAEMVGRGHAVVREVDRANLLLNAVFGTFYLVGYDGLALASTAHTLHGDATAYSPADTNLTAVPSRSATTWSNRLATDSDLDYSSYIDALTLLMSTVNREGDFTNITPRWFTVPTSLWAVAREITRSTDRPDTANRATSVVNDIPITVVRSSYFIDTDAWAIFGARHDFNFFNRMTLRTRLRDQPGNWDQVAESYSRHGIGCHDPRGGVFTPGA